MPKKIMQKVADTHIRGFAQFIREQGVIGLATGFILGGAVSKVVSAFVTDIINPILSIALGAADEFRQSAVSVGGAQILWGDFLSVLIDFVIVAAVVYFGFKVLGLEKLDKKKEKAETK
ncbi:MAG: MscL family protein [Candidatus Moranbacteria bacterium]|nr:MscL family protein [Candidatus Moranbacteria bacterium]